MSVFLSVCNTDMQTNCCNFDGKLKFIKTSVGSEFTSDAPYTSSNETIMYLSMRECLEILFGTIKIAYYCVVPLCSHLDGVKRVMEYFSSTRDLGLVYRRYDNMKLSAY